jgi:hypothetical protein
MLSLVVPAGSAAHAASFQLGIRLDVTRHSFLAQEDFDTSIPWSQDRVKETVDSDFNAYTTYGVATLNWAGGNVYDLADIRLDPTLRGIFQGLSLGEPTTRVSGGTNQTGYKLWADEDRQERALGVTLFERHLAAEVLSFQNFNFDPPGDNPELSYAWQLNHFAPGTKLDWLFEGARWTSQDAERYGTGLVGGRYRGIATIESVTAVPEPATWAMLLGGFAATGAAMRRRRHATVRYA